MSRVHKERPCPVCRSAEFSLAKRAVWQVCGLGPISTGFGLCRDCGMIYQNPLPSDEIINAYYERFSNYLISDPENWTPPSEPQSPTTRRLIELACKHKPNRGTLYEIGCSYGFHLQHLKNDGWTAMGCEPSVDASAQARDIVGLDVEVGFAHECLKGNNAFDAIIMSHVLEHVSEPAHLLAIARDNIADDGVILIEVPCARAPEAIGPSWLMLEHLSYFSEQTLTRLIQSSGLSVMDVILDDDSFIYPTITVSCQKSLTFKASTHNAHDRSRSFLDQLLEYDRIRWQNTEQTFQHIDEAYIWGAGLHTSELFAQTNILDKVEIKAIIDGSPLKQGAQLGTCDVISPSEFESVSEHQTVIISSFSAEQVIARVLRKMGLSDDQIICLYDQ
jgi:SAM-dependent methyltransferase